MKKLLIAVSMAAVALFSSTASAETITFQKGEYTIDVPAEWKKDINKWNGTLTITSPKKDLSLRISAYPIFAHDKSTNMQRAKKQVRNFGDSAVNFKKVNNTTFTFQTKNKDGKIDNHYRYVYPKGAKYRLEVCLQNPSGLAGKKPIPEKEYKKEIDTILKSVKPVQK